MTIRDSARLDADSVETLDGGTLVLDKAETFGAMHIASGGVLTHTAGAAGFDLTILGNLTVDAGA